MFISGWGDTLSIKESNAYLRGAKVPIYDFEKCQKRYKILSSQMVCAGYYGGGVDSCQGKFVNLLIKNLVILILKVTVEELFGESLTMCWLELRALALDVENHDIQGYMQKSHQQSNGLKTSHWLNINFSTHFPPKLKLSIWENEMKLNKLHVIIITWTKTTKERKRNGRARKNFHRLFNNLFKIQIYFMF